MGEKPNDMKLLFSSLLIMIYCEYEIYTHKGIKTKNQGVKKNYENVWRCLHPKTNGTMLEPYRLPKHDIE